MSLPDIFDTVTWTPTCNADTKVTANICLPPVVSCTGPGDIGGDIFVDDINKLYNCIRCAGDPPYFNPVATGDIFSLQFNFRDKVNDPVSVPSFGWYEVGGSPVYGIRIELIDMDNAIISSNISQFAEQWVWGYDLGSGQTYQNVLIDVDKVLALLTPPNQCFSFKITTYYRQASTIFEDVVYYTEPFQVEPCLDTLLIEGAYSQGDCKGGFYQEFVREHYIAGYDNIISSTTADGNYAHFNRWRIPAVITPGEDVLEIERFNLSAVESTTQNLYVMQMTKPIPVYLRQFIVGQILAAGEVIIDNVDRYLSDSFTTENIKGRPDVTWLGTFPLLRECSTNLRC